MTMYHQTVTLYHKSYDGDVTAWARHVLKGVHLSLSDGETVSATGVVARGGSTLMVPRQADADRVGNGDYIVSGLCPAESFTGNPVKVLSEYAPMRVSGRKRYPFRSRLAHATFTLEGAWK